MAHHEHVAAARHVLQRHAAIAVGRVHRSRCICVRTEDVVPGEWLSPAALNVHASKGGETTRARECGIRCGKGYMQAVLMRERANTKAQESRTAQDSGRRQSSSKQGHQNGAHQYAVKLQNALTSRVLDRFGLLSAAVCCLLGCAAAADVATLAAGAAAAAIRVSWQGIESQQTRVVQIDVRALNVYQRLQQHTKHIFQLAAKLDDTGRQR